MTYYGLVDKLKDKHKSGIYGRRKLSKEEIKLLDENLAKTVDGWWMPVLLPFTSVSSIIMNSLKNKVSPISLKHPDNSNQIVISNEALEDNYSIDEDMGLFYGLLDNFPSKDKVFEKIMKSNGGSTLIIMEKDKVHGKMHFGGPQGKFSAGLYCTHPKDSNLLIPLINFNETIKSLILEETISAYEALGAKKITIEDITSNDGRVGGTSKGKEANISAGHGIEKLREKKFGKGVFNPVRAVQGKMFIHDIPAVMTTINARINGNQTGEEFKETINLNVGLDIGVLDLFGTTLNYSYRRTWSFNVEFYDKNDLNSSTDRSAEVVTT